jgi:L,D-transpeptidase catalytic domain
VSPRALPCSLAALGVLLAGCASHERDPAPEEPAPAASAAPAEATRDAPPSASTAPKPANAATDGPRLYAKSRFVWVHPQPSESGWIGYLWFGGSVKLKDPEPVRGPGCGGKWYAIEPRGYVCVDGERATLDEKDPVFQAVRPYAPDLSSPWPHRYAESRGLYRYDEIPSDKEQRMREWDLPDHLKAMEAVRGGAKATGLLDGVDLTPAKAAPFSLGPLPPTIHEQRRRLTPLSTVAYSADVEKDGRSWLLSADLFWVPKDRLVPYPKVTFEGVHLGHGDELPIAFFRGSDRPEFQLSDGKLSEISARFARLSHVALTGKTMEQDGATFYETKQKGIWVKKDDAVIPTPQEQTPWGAPVGGADTKQGPEGRRTWLEASVWKGWLIAYEGTRPVFVTMISPGRGGTPERGKDPISTASTPVGVFPITGKFATATMVAPGEFIHSDVPWTQNFHGAHALHGAYWHDDWGNRKSGGCVNVSPIDGKWLYEFTEPPVPEGWHGVRWRPNEEPATRFVVHE